MTKKQALKRSLICLGVIAFSFLILFKVWWTQSADKFMGVGAFLVAGIGLIVLSATLTRLLVATDFGFSDIADQQAFNEFAKKVGYQKARRVTTLVTCLFFGLAALSFYLFYKATQQWETYQLTRYGQYQKVEIKDVRKKGKGRPYAFFDYYLNGKRYSNDLSQKDFNIGDSVEIIFSTEDPEILEWSEDFVKEQ